MLTDAEGVTIDYRVDRDRRYEFKRAGLYPGSCWSEREEGRCGVASVLHDAEAITVHKTDHFRAAFTTLTCSASPIFGVQGELIGVLDASAVRSPEERESQRLVNHIVRQSALLIEDGFFLNATSHCWVLLAHRGHHYVEAQPEILIAFDARGYAIAANRREGMCAGAGPVAAPRLRTLRYRRRTSARCTARPRSHLVQVDQLRVAPACAREAACPPRFQKPGADTARSQQTDNATCVVRKRNTGTYPHTRCDDRC